MAGGNDDDNKGSKSLPDTPASGRELPQPELIRSCESVLAEDSFSSVDEICFKKKEKQPFFLSAVISCLISQACLLPSPPPTAGCKTMKRQRVNASISLQIFKKNHDQRSPGRSPGGVLGGRELAQTLLLLLQHSFSSLPMFPLNYRRCASRANPIGHFYARKFITTARY